MSDKSKQKGIVINTFGGFNIFFEDRALSDTPIRRGKMWIILKFLITHHKRSVSVEELIDLLWSDGDCSNPAGSLNTMICRLRKILSEFFGDSEFQCISYSNGQYSWNPTVKCIIDTAEFEKTIVQAKDGAKTTGERIASYEKALTFYRGDFLRGEGNELWLINFVNYYRRLYFNAVDELAALYEQQIMFEEAVNVYSEAIKIEPYEEALYARQIRLLIDLGEYARAKQQYQSIAKILTNEFDAKPSSALSSLLFEIGSPDEKYLSDLNEIKNQFENNIVKKAAIFCGPETFKRIYHYDKYLDERMQFPVFLAMLTVQSDNNLLENNVRLRSVMKTLRKIILDTLRHCDVVCQYAANQFLIMLTATSDKNKMAPLIRIQKLFEKESVSDGIDLHTEAISISGKDL